MLFYESLNLLQTMVVLKGELIAHFYLAHKQIAPGAFDYFLEQMSSDVQQYPKMSYNIL